MGARAGAGDAEGGGGGGGEGHGGCDDDEAIQRSKPAAPRQ